VSVALSAHAALTLVPSASPPPFVATVRGRCSGRDCEGQSAAMALGSGRREEGLGFPGEMEAVFQNHPHIWPKTLLLELSSSSWRTHLPFPLPFSLSAGFLSSPRRRRTAWQVTAAAASDESCGRFRRGRSAPTKPVDARTRPWRRRHFRPRWTLPSPRLRHRSRARKSGRGWSYSSPRQKENKRSSLDRLAPPKRFGNE
jgi:hypothetical protein